MTRNVNRVLKWLDCGIGLRSIVQLLWNAVLWRRHLTGDSRYKIAFMVWSADGSTSCKMCLEDCDLQFHYPGA